MLPDAKIPIMSFGYFLLAAGPSSGKTYNMMRICEAYVEQAEKHTYNLEEPFLLNGPIDLVFYVSPSVRSDETFRN